MGEQLLPHYMAEMCKQRAVLTLSVKVRVQERQVVVLDAAWRGKGANDRGQREGTEGIRDL